VGGLRSLNFVRDMYYVGMDGEKKAWDRLPSESQRAHEAFRAYLYLPSSQRSIVNAYRSTRNPSARKPSDTWSRWAIKFSWTERAQAFDDHVEIIRYRGTERAIEQEAERRAAEAERTRNRCLKLMNSGFEEAMRWMEDVGSSGMRAQDVIAVIKLHLEATDKLGGLVGEAGQSLGDNQMWSEEGEDEEFDRIVAEVDAAREAQGLEEEEPEPEEGVEEDCENDEGSHN
jgi:hypothetical protein